MKEIRVAIIGTGVISRQHMERYKAIPNAKVVAACDINKPKLEAFGKTHGIPEDCLYTDYRELLKRDDLDSVDVCLHNNLHLPMAYEVLKSGKNCYCEKPMAGSYADAKALFDYAKNCNKELAVHLDFIFNRQSRVGAKMIADGELGRVYHARSVGLRRRMRPGLDVPPPMFAYEFIKKEWAGHGALYDMGVYHISQKLFMLGLPKLQRVSGQVYQEMSYMGKPASEAGMEVDEFGVGFAKYENGLTLDIIETWAAHTDELGPELILGSKGGLKFINEPGMRGTTPGLMFFTEGATGDIDIDLRIGGNGMLAAMSDPMEMYYTDDQAHWIAYLAGNLKERLDTPQIALATMLVSEGIFLSSTLGREVTADEIETLSVSTAMRKQETEWGTFTYLE